MRYLRCPTCTRRVFFDDLSCLWCHTMLGYRPSNDELAPSAGDTCAGRARWGCNWLLADGVGWCRSCRLDVAENSPHPGDPSDAERRVFETAKRRVVRQLLLAGLDLHAEPQLRFQFDRSTDGRHVMIGHADGLVTLDLAEADPAVSARTRTELGEAYRTPLGHVRHETGHWHWQAWVATVPSRLDRFRSLFGDERADYASALEAHYSAGSAPDDWSDRFVSDYASAHPWEDYAESFAHVLHMVDTIETARISGVVGGDPNGAFDDVYGEWSELSVTLNELSRSMGVPDPYPFAPPAPAVDKLRFVFDVLFDR